jgi:hypothetical protein
MGRRTETCHTMKRGFLLTPTDESTTTESIVLTAVDADDCVSDCSWA